MIERDISKIILKQYRKFPVISITGPRQSGKTTLIRSLFPKLPYISLEDPDVRLIAKSDPRGFLNNYKNGAVLDEVQRTPELFSYIQTIVDSNSRIKFVLSGSQSFLLHNNISQTLAGRVAIFRLLPFNLHEIEKGKTAFKNYYEIIFKGFYPRIYDKKIESSFFYQNYVQTYIERDVRQLKNVNDLNLFTKFIKLCAGRTGQILNYSSFANDCGISVNTAKAWISLLEASYIIYLLQPFYKNFNKRLIKMPKLYFYDTGLVCSLLGMENKKQLHTHYLIGSIFENFIISEFLKFRYNNAQLANCYFWRDNKGSEIDLLIDSPAKLIPIEIKAGQTVTNDYFKEINIWNKFTGGQSKNSFVIYGGDTNFKNSNGSLISWKNINNFFISEF